MSTLEGTLYLELVVNRHASGRVVPVQATAGRFKVDAADLRQTGLPVPDAEQGGVWLDAMAGMVVHYDGIQQRLLLTVPASWLPEQQLGATSIFERQTALSSFGALLNYQLYSTFPSSGRGQTAVWNEFRVFGALGVLRNTGTFRQPHGGGPAAGRGYQRYDTQWRISDESRAVTVEVGDLISNALAWSRPSRLAGVQVSRDFSVRPDVITYPLPRFSGEAAVPTTVDLFIDGYRNSTAEVAPGPYTLTNVPFINGAGQAVVVTTDALGRQVSTTVPFYVSSSLLNPGMSDYSLAVGSMREDYGVKSLSYGGWAGSASYRYGLSRTMTLEGHAEGAGRMRGAGLGAVFTVADKGSINIARSESASRGGSGHQTTVGYQYANRGFNVGIQRMERTAGYTDLSDVPGRFRAGRRSVQANASASLGGAGSVGAAYFDVRDHDAGRTRLLNLSWSKPLWGNTSMWVTSNRQVGGRGWSVLMQLLIPIGSRDTLSGAVERRADGRLNKRVDYQRSVAGEGGFGWDLAYGDAGDGGAYRQASLAWRGRAAQLEGGVYGQQGRDTRWGSANGSLVLMDGAIVAANGIQDAFVLVSTDGVKDVPVRYENQLVGSTDSSGHLLMPWAISYYSGKYEVDTLDLPSNYSTELVEQRVAVRAGSGYLLKFPIARVGAASILLHGVDGAPIAIGARVTGDKGQTGVVGWDGWVYLQGMHAHNRLRVELPQGQACGAAFDLDPNLDEIAHVGPLVCR